LVFFINDIQSFFEIRAVSILTHILSGHDSGRRSIADDSDALGLRVELGGADLDLTFSCRVGPRVVRKVYLSRAKALDVTSEGADMNLRVRLDDFDLVLEIHWAVTFHLKLLGVRLTDHAASTHVNKLGEKLILSRIDDWEGMDRD